MSARRRRPRHPSAWVLLAALGTGATLHGSATTADEGTTATPSPSDAAPFTRRFYVGAGIGASRIEPYSPIDALSVGDDRDTGFHFSLGYDVARWLSAELQLADLGAARIDRTLGGTAMSPSTVQADFDAIDYRIADIAALFYLFNTRSGIASRRPDIGLHRREGLSLYTRVGLGVMRNDAERGLVRHERNFSGHLAFGLGLEYGFVNGFALRAEYVAYDSDAHYASLGAIKRFGRVVEPDDPEPPEPPKPPGPIEPPEPPEPQTARGEFGFDESVPTPASRADLDRFADAVRDDQREILVEGHTDAVGSLAYNDALASRRANAVAEYLIGRGIAAERLQVESYGERQLLTTDTTPEGHARNRRVDVRAR